MLSIIIISKDEEKTLPRLLKSIKKQKFKDYEIIVSDAKSKDKTQSIAKKYGCKIVEGGFPSKGRNNGAKVAGGDIFLFLDADTKLTKNFLKENLKEFFEKNLVVASPIPIPISKKIIDKVLSWVYIKYMLTVQYFSPNGTGFCIFCKQEVFKKIKGFDEKLRLSEDHDFIKRCSKYGKFRILRSRTILFDVRRFEREGRFHLLLKYLIMGFSELFGIRRYNSLFDYEMQGINMKNQK